MQTILDPGADRATMLRLIRRVDGVLALLHHLYEQHDRKAFADWFDQSESTANEAGHLPALP